MPALAGIESWEERESTERRHVSRVEVRHWPAEEKYDKAALCAIGPGRLRRRLLTWLCARMWLWLTVHNFRLRGGQLVTNCSKDLLFFCHCHTVTRRAARRNGHILFPLYKKEKWMSGESTSTFECLPTWRCGHFKLGNIWSIDRFQHYDGE